MNLQALYAQRFPPTRNAQRERLWSVLCRRVLQRYVQADDTVLDLGAGACEFLRHIRCARKVAIDLSPAVRSFAGPDIHVIVGDILPIVRQIADGAVQVVFCSNVLEHLPSKDTVWAVLQESVRILGKGGRLVILQPNIRVAFREYWDFFDHYVPLSDRSLREAVETMGLEVVTLKPRFLPLTTVRPYPQPAWLLHIYLSLPPLQWLFGKQLLLVARKRK